MAEDLYLVTERELQSATVNTAGELEFTRENGQKINAGKVRGDITPEAIAARDAAVSARDAAVAAKNAAQAVGTTNDTIMTNVAKDPASQFGAQLSATIAEGVETGVQASAPFVEQSARYAAAEQGGMTSGPDWNAHLGVGSSTIHGLTSQLSALAADFNATYVNVALGGISIEHNLAMLGARPALTAAFVTVPASGAVTVGFSNVSAAVNAAPSWHGHFDGFESRPGTISKAPGFTAGYTFTPDASGPSVVVPPGRAFIPDNAIRSDSPAVVNLGKNNLTQVSGGTFNVQSVINMTVDALNWLDATGHPVVILLHFVDTNTPADAAVRSRIEQYNTAIKARFGYRCVSMSDILTSPQAWIDSGITPTPTDLAQQAIGNKPPSLSVDDLHLNGAGNALIRAAIDAKVTELRWQVAAGDISESLLASWRADSLTGADGTTVSAWESVGGSLAPIAFAPTPNGPTILADGIAGHKAVKFLAASSQGLSTPDGGFSLTEATFAIAFRVTATTGGAQDILTGDANGRYRVYTNSTGRYTYLTGGAASNELLGNSEVATGDYQINVYRAKPGGALVLINGQSFEGSVTAQTQDRLRIGVGAGASSNFANIEVAALDVYDAGLTDAGCAQARDALIAYLNS